MRRWQCSLDQATPLHMVRCIRISVSDRWFVLLPHLQSHRIIQKISGNHKTPIPLTCKAVCFSDFCTKIPFGNLCQRGRLTTQKIEPFFTPGSCRSWRDQRRWQINGGQGNWCGLNLYTGGQLKKNKVLYVQSKTKKHTSYRLFVSFHGYNIPFFGGEDGIYQSERFSSCDHMWSVSQAGGGSGYEAGC